jgi:acetoin utilization deacetylase AcuC-like enzyme
MDAWFSAHHAGHQGHGELIGGRLVGGFELPVRAEHVRGAFIAAGLGAVHAPADAGLAPILAVHDRALCRVSFSSAWARWAALGHTHPALGMAWHAGLGLPQHRAAPHRGRAGLLVVRRRLRHRGRHLAGGLLERAVRHRRRAGAAGRCAPAPSPSAGRRATTHQARAMGGYCYLNNAAIAVQAAAGRRRAARGRGRHRLPPRQRHAGHLLARDDVFVTSLHADPHDDYPYLSGHADEVGEGAGAGFNLNLPLPAGTTAAAYLAALDVAIDATLAQGCGAVVVSLGVDTFERDPISKFQLASNDYLAIGARLRRLGVPVLFVFEGGYATDEVGLNAVNVLVGFTRG